MSAYLFFIGGSGCVSYKYYLREFLNGLQSGVKVYALQKAGVKPGSTGIFGCSDEFHEHDHFGRWLADQKAFIRSVTANATDSPGKIILFGVSEGGNLAAAIASQLPEITHLAVIGSGGMPQIDELRLLNRKHRLNWDIDRAEREIRLNPKSTTKRVFGHTYRYWSSVMDLDAAELYRQLEIPILVGFGEEDASVPVESATHLAEQMRSHGRDNFRLKIYEGANHNLVGSEGRAYRTEFIALINQWL